MKTYAQLLKDPRWQKKRLEILERDEFTCQSCYDKDNTLHVHHCYYSTGKSPWEYPSGSLVTLCEDCHACEKDALQEKIAFTDAFSMCGFKSEEFNNMACCVHESMHKGYISSLLPEVAADMIALSLINKTLFQAMKDNYFEVIKKRSEVNHG